MTAIVSKADISNPNSEWLSLFNSNFLRLKEAHRSRAHKLQRFDHPPPEGLIGRRGSKSDLDARSSDVCFKPMN